MNQKNLWTTAAVFLSVASLPAMGFTQTARGSDPIKQASTKGDAVKVGEYHSPTREPDELEGVTKIKPHSLQGRQAATLYIRNTPVLTFLGSRGETKVGDRSSKVVKYGSVNTGKSPQITSGGSIRGAKESPRSILVNDPVYRASLVAAKINQLVLDSADGRQITVSWNPKGKHFANNRPSGNESRPTSLSSGNYTIRFDGKELVEINESTRLADGTNNLAKDALQATNHLRKILGEAPEVKEIANLPKPGNISIPKLPQKVVIGGIRINFRGMASWYGYDWAGRKTANGERFNPEAMTAAHRTLPMGTRVRVTNTHNGRSVVVRINDRGPYIGGRVIDLSVGAAKILGMVSSGVAAVRIEVLGR
ncbi:MAG: septal ring lytic transglycosylase RlpA family protein [Cylindrospermopsis raciborskii]|jgi:rare lipoprotein A|uniref:septal ring lytic transglycosylase RlpA family protein n=1 Tax=Cylindrospermopsis raciborskii TaxID=77022 RepID=UPI003D0BD5B8